MSEDFSCWVTNVYSASGRVQVRRFGHDDNVQDETKLKWAYVDGGTDHIQTAGVGKTHALQRSMRVHCTQVGGSDGSLFINASFPRGGKGTGGGGGLGSSQADGSTAMTDVDRSKADNCIPLENPNQQDGIRCQAKPADGRYHPDTGKPLDLASQSGDYPSTYYKDA